MKENKKKLVGIIISVIILIVIVLTAAYAYFVAQTGVGAKTNVSVTAETTDSLQFKTEGEINIEATMENFSEGKENRTGSTSATAILIAGKDSTPSYDYNVYLDISSNSFQYTTEAKTPELVLKVIGPDNQPVTSISGLTYNESSGGFDITEASGLIKIVEGYNITTTSNETQNWNVEVILVNLNSNQNLNLNKEFISEIKIGQDSEETLADHIKSLYTTDGENNLYYHDGEGSYTNAELEAGDNSYRYSGANPENFVCFGSSSELCPNDSLYRIIGVFDDKVKMIKYDYANSNLLGENGDYNPAVITPSESSNYRGNHRAINAYYWNKINYDLTYAEKGFYNSWDFSKLNQINLNINYINNIGHNWANKIDTNDWYIGGLSSSFARLSNTKMAYNAELGTNGTGKDIIYNTKIGLMYISEYYYAAEPNFWIYPGYTSSSNPDKNGNYGDSYDYRAAINDDWMFMGINEWTISRRSEIDTYNFVAFSLTSLGYMYHVGNINNLIRSVRPTFYLKENVKYVSGTGAQSDPYRIQ